MVIGGAIIGAAVLATGALRNAVIADGHPFPHENVLLYGVFFSALLALIYIPTHIKLATLGGRIRDLHCPPPRLSDEHWSAQYQKRKELDEFLQLKTDSITSFRSGVAILAPLTSGIIGVLLSQGHG